MFEMHQNTLCVQASWMIEEKIISSSNYKQLCTRGHLNKVTRGGNGNKALIQFDTMRTDLKEKVIELAGDPYAKVTSITFTDYIENDQKAFDFFRNFTLDSGEALPEKTQLEYCCNAAILNALSYIEQNKMAQRKAMAATRSKADLWKRLAEIVSSLPKHAYPHTLPTNARKLKDKLKQYLNDGFSCLIHKNFGHKNAEKLNDDAKSFVFARWCDRVKRVANYGQLLREYNAEAQQQGWPELKSEQTLINFLTDPKIENLWYGHRFGELKAKEKYNFQFKTSLPTMRDSLWYADGTKLNLFYKDEKGNRATINVYEVMDAYSEVFLGYFVSQSEDYEAIYHAFKMAIKISGHRPYQISLDNGSGNKKLETGNFLGRISRLAIKTAPYNGKSKTIESAFGRFQTQFLAQEWNFTGQNITSTKVSSHPNMEFILRNTDKLPTLAEVKETYFKRRQEWNSAPHPKTGIPRIDMYFQSENDQAPELSPFQMVDTFWIDRAEPITAHASGITFKEKKVKYDFVVYKEDSRDIDLEWHRNNVDNKFHVKFDPDDMTLIYLYKKTPLGLTFVKAAETAPVVVRGKQEQTDLDAQFIKDIELKNKVIRIEARDKADLNLAHHGMRAVDYGFDEPLLKGVESGKNQRRKLTRNPEIGGYQKEVSEMVPQTADLYDRM